MVCIDTQFESNKLDNRFKDWADNGITAVCNIIYACPSVLLPT